MEFSAKDKNGETITDKRYIELVSSREKKTAFPSYNAIVADDQTGEPGKELSFQTGSSASDVFVIRAREGLDDSLTTYSFYKLNNEIKSTA